MTTITIERRDLRPHDTVSGRVTWALEHEPRELELRLCWFTRGRGTEESRTVEAVPLGDTMHGEKPFSIRLPAEPWSMNGALVRIAWALEVVAKKSGALAMEEIIVAPDRREIELREVADSKTATRTDKWASKFARFNQR